MLAHQDDGALPSPLEVAEAAHPTAAVCGTPTAAAGQLIEQLEGLDRGPFSGPVGWLDAAGNAEFGIALRGGVLESDGLAGAPLRRRGDRGKLRPGGGARRDRVQAASDAQRARRSSDGIRVGERPDPGVKIAQQRPVGGDLHNADADPVVGVSQRVLKLAE